MLQPINPDHPEPRKIARAIDLIEKGEVIGYPTDTVYGLGCDLMNKQAIERIYQIKGMRKDKNLAFICPDLSDIARYAVVDVGTNTVRLLVAEQEEGRLTPAHTDKQLVRLGRDLAREGRISDESLAHVGTALRRYATVARKLGAVDVRIIATSAAREAENGHELAEQTLAETGHELEIIDEQEEARLAWAGALNALDEPWEGEVGVVDVGGRAEADLLGDRTQGGVVHVAEALGVAGEVGAVDPVLQHGLVVDGHASSLSRMEKTSS